MAKISFTVINGGKDENSSPTPKNPQDIVYTTPPKCKFCSQEMKPTGTGNYYCTCQAFNTYMGLLENIEKLKKSYEQNMLAYQKIGQKLIEESDYYKKVIAISQKRIANKDPKDKIKTDGKTIDLNALIEYNKQDREESEDILGYYWFPPMS